MVLVTKKLGWTRVIHLRKKTLGCLATLFCFGPAFVGQRRSGAKELHGRAVVVRIPTGVKGFSFINADDVVWGPPSLLRAYSLGVKQTDNETTSPSSCTESENAWSCASFAPLVGHHKEGER